MKKLMKYFLQGLLYIAPFSITVYIIYALFNFIDNLLEKSLLKILNVDIPGLGLLIIVIIIILVGIIGHTIIARPFKVLFNRFLDNMPFLKVIYSALNDLFSAFVGKERKFTKPVLVLVNPVSNLEKLGFLTEEDLSRLNETGKVAVYFPHSYNFSGELYIVPKENIKSIDVNPAEVMKFIVSAGVSGWEEAENKAL
jgi:uncharacterized membrane protein